MSIEMANTFKAGIEKRYLELFLALKCPKRDKFSKSYFLTLSELTEHVSPQAAQLNIPFLLLSQNTVRDAPPLGT